jgi:hypothetical protein
MEPGDVVLCHSEGIVGSAIRWAQRREYSGAFSQYNHVAIIDRIEDGVAYIIQAEAAGVTNDKQLESVAPGGTYRVIPLPESVDKDKFLEFARSQVGALYGFTTILSCALDVLLPESICLRKYGTWICSGLVAAALMYGGFKPTQGWGDIYTTFPSEIAKELLTLV